jgi:hypothetical protein
VKKAALLAFVDVKGGENLAEAAVFVVSVFVNAPFARYTPQRLVHCFAESLEEHGAGGRVSEDHPVSFCPRRDFDVFFWKPAKAKRDTTVDGGRSDSNEVRRWTTSFVHRFAFPRARWCHPREWNIRALGHHLSKRMSDVQKQTRPSFNVDVALRIAVPRFKSSNLGEQHALQPTEGTSSKLERVCKACAHRIFAGLLADAAVKVLTNWNVRKSSAPRCCL